MAAADEMKTAGARRARDFFQPMRNTLTNKLLCRQTPGAPPELLFEMSRENKPACSQFCRHDNFSGLCDILNRQHERGRGGHGKNENKCANLKILLDFRGGGGV